MQVPQNIPTILFKKLKHNFFFQINVFFSAWCDKTNQTQNYNLGIFDSHNNTGKLDKIECRTMTRRTKKLNKFSAKQLDIFLQFFFEVFDSQIGAKKLQKQILLAQNYVFRA